MGERFAYRLIDMAGGEIGIVQSEVEKITEGDQVQMPDGRPVEVVEIYDDEHGREGGVQSTLVVDDGSVPDW